MLYVLTPVMSANRFLRQLVNQCALFDVGLKIFYAISPYVRASRRRAFPCRCSPFVF